MFTEKFGKNVSISLQMPLEKHLHEMIFDLDCRLVIWFVYFSEICVVFFVIK